MLRRATSALALAAIALAAQAAPALRSQDRVVPAADPAVYDVTIRGRVVDASKEPVASARVVLQQPMHAYFARSSPPAAETRTHDDGSFELRAGRLADSDVTLVVASVSHARPLVLGIEAPSGSVLDLGTLDVEGARVSAAAERTVVSGVVVAKDGAPLSGWRVGFGDRPRWFGDGLGSVAVTDAAGSFLVASDVHQDRRWLSVHGPGDAFSEVRDGFDAPLRIEMQGLVPVTIPLRGMRADEVSVAWLHGEEWSPLPGATFLGGKREHVLRVEAPGHLPRLVVRTLDRTLSFPDVVTPEVSFEEDVPRSLRVVARGEPVAGARVVILARLLPEQTQGAAWGAEILLGTLVADARGEVSVLGPAGTLRTAVVHAEGFEPMRFHWDAGAHVTVEPAPRDAEIVFTGLQRGETLRVAPSGTTRSVRRAKAWQEGETISARLAPGAYDAVVLDGGNRLLRGRSFAARSGETTRVDLAEDALPICIVELPRRIDAAEWLVSVQTGDTLPGGPAGAMAVTLDASAPRRAPRPRVEDLPDGTVEARLPGPGTYFVRLDSRSYRGTLFREFTVAPGERIRIAAPRLTATLHGSMILGFRNGRTERFAHHGVAGPRLWLRSDRSALGASAWDVVIPFPKTGDDARFVAASLPPGPIHVYHQLGSVDEWSGVPARLADGETTTLPDFGEIPAGDLTVFVRDARGRPVRGATLLVRDRLAEAWHEFSLQPTTGVYAAYPLVPPPWARLDGAPATLPSIQAGRLELRVELDDGRVVELERDVAPPAPLEIRLPVEMRR